MWKRTQGLDGNAYDSQAEAHIADWMMARQIEYEPHKRLPPPSRQKCDWFLPKLGTNGTGLWVEYDGLQEVRADNKLARKIQFYEEHHLDYVVITRENWQSRLYEVILGA